MLGQGISEFSEANLAEFDLRLQEVTVFSGLCTELLPPGRGRRFCFQHYTFQVKLLLLNCCFISSFSLCGCLMATEHATTGCRVLFCFCCSGSFLLLFLFQEFMAALYVLQMFHCHSINILETGSTSKFSRMLPVKKPQVAGLLHCALERTLSASPGHSNLLLRFLCGLLSPDCHHSQLSGFLFPRHMPRIAGLQEARQHLVDAVTGPRLLDREQLENLQQCLHEMVLEEL